MKKLDSTYWTDGKDIFYRAGEEWVKVEVKPTPKRVIDAGTIVAQPLKKI